MLLEYNNFDTALRYALPEGRRALVLVVILDEHFGQSHLVRCRLHLFARALEGAGPAERSDAVMLYSRAAAMAGELDTFKKYRRKAR